MSTHYNYEDKLDFRYAEFIKRVAYQNYYDFDLWVGTCGYNCKKYPQRELRDGREWKYYDWIKMQDKEWKWDS